MNLFVTCSTFRQPSCRSFDSATVAFRMLSPASEVFKRRDTTETYRGFALCALTHLNDSSAMAQS